ncbi:MAG: ABC transporter ATP-binding protein [Muribaculaceae bacterium]|nr:ABC transporter ATP-binding protein [Muribaculaceae bacterium]
MEILKTSALDIGYHNSNKNTYLVAGNINVSIKNGEVICLLGANGKGKSTLLRTLAGTQQPIAGSIKINGNDIDKISKRELANILSLVYTDRTQAGGLTVKELVELGRHPHTGFLGRLNENDHKIVEKAMADTGIAHKANNFIAELSDGERQKAMIARALAQETPIIFLDEPTAFLDIASKIDTMRLLHDLAQNNNKAILLSSHDVSQAILMADRLWIIDKSGTLISGYTEDLIINGSLSTIFDSEKIIFDCKNGIFKTNDNYKIHTNLICKDSILRHWTENALRRSAIEPNNDSNNDTSIVVNSHNDILLTISGDKTFTLNSIEELILKLKNYYQ